MSSSSCEYVAEVFRALSHPKRLAIVELLLKGPRTVTEIAESIGVPQPVASQHLRVLRDAGIVESEWGGRQPGLQALDREGRGAFQACP